MKIKMFIVLCVLSSMIFLVTSCTDDYRKNNDIENPSENSNDTGVTTSAAIGYNGDTNTTSAAITYDSGDKPDNQTVTSNEALQVVENVAKMLTHVDDIKCSNILNVGDVYYIKVVVADKYLDYDCKYSDIDSYHDNFGDETIEIWRYEKNKARRILYNMKKIDYTMENNIIKFSGYENYYMVKCDDDMQNIKYECYFTDILNNRSGDKTCYINACYSVCVVDNTRDEVIMNKYMPEPIKADENLLTEAEDFVLDNNRCFIANRYSYICNMAWLDESKICYTVNDMVIFYALVDLNKKMIGCDVISGHSTFDLDDAVIIENGSAVTLDITSSNNLEMEKENISFNLYNMLTNEKIFLGKTFGTLAHIHYEAPVLIYGSPMGRDIAIDISDYIDKDRKKLIDKCVSRIEREHDITDVKNKQLERIDNTYIESIEGKNTSDEIICQLYYFQDDLCQCIARNADEIDMYRFNGDEYVYVECADKSRMIHFMQNGEINIIEGKFIDINFEETGKNISLCSEDGNIIILDELGKEVLKENIFEYSSKNGVDDELSLDEVEISTSIWDENAENLYIFTSKEGALYNFFKIDMVNDNITDLAFDIDCRLNNIYFNVKRNYILYYTYPYDIQTYTHDKVDRDVFLCIKYLDTGVIDEIYRTHGESIYFWFYDDEIGYREDYTNDNICYKIK